jgi:phage repressor protein C with HTH and peptisase S24 domain
MSLGKRIRDRRNAVKLTQEQFATELRKQLPEDVTLTRSAVAQWEAENTAPTMDKMEVIARVLQTTAAFLLGDETQSSQTTDVRPVELPVQIAALGALPRTVPVWGTTVGGGSDTAYFILNRGGEPIDFIGRPPMIANSTQVIAFQVQGDSMARWRRSGDYVFVNKRPAKPGDHVALECHPEEAGDGHPCYLKELVAETPTKYRLLQYNPERTLEIPKNKVITVWRVIEWEELLGL